MFPAFIFVVGVVDVGFGGAVSRIVAKVHDISTINIILRLQTSNLMQQTVNSAKKWTYCLLCKEYIQFVDIVVKLFSQLEPQKGILILLMHYSDHYNILFRLAMQPRDTFQLSYSPSLKASKIRISLPPEQQDGHVQDLSPNKQNLFMTFKQSILEPHEPQAELLSSLTSVQPSLPCSETQEAKKQKDEKQIQTSLPFAKDIAKTSTKAEQNTNKNNARMQSQRARVSKESLLKRIQDATSFLVYGIEVEKYCFRIKKIQRSVLFFSEDVQFMGILRTINAATKIVSMKECEGISVGVKTQRFKDYLQSGYPIKEQNAMSIVFKERSYDFTVRCNAIRDRLARQLKFLWQQNKDEK